mgnify:CR=1 FL=1
MLMVHLNQHLFSEDFTGALCPVPCALSEDFPFLKIFQYRDMLNILPKLY